MSRRGTRTVVGKHGLGGRRHDATVRQNHIAVNRELNFSVLLNQKVTPPPQGLQPVKEDGRNELRDETTVAAAVVLCGAQ